ncbi:MAG: hypothetical protein R3D67_08740 [Hyphomicrobiaceae bacterium]
MSGTSLVLLAMYSTVNVMGPGGMATRSGEPYILALLLAAGVFTFAGMLIVGSGPAARHVPKGPALARARRHMAGPRERRA